MNSPPQATRDASDRQAQDTRTRILRHAGVIFAEKGFESATVREICKAADVNLASINYHFGDKESLYLETIRLAHQLRVQQVPGLAYTNEAEPEQQLRDFIQMLLSRILGVNAEAWQPALMMREVLNPSEACRDLVESYFRPQLDELIGIMSPMLPTSLSRARRTQMAFSVIGQCLFYRFSGEVVAMLTSQQSRSHYEVRSLANHISEFTLAAIRGLQTTPLAKPPAAKPSSVPSPHSAKSSSPSRKQAEVQPRRSKGRAAKRR